MNYARISLITALLATTALADNCAATDKQAQGDDIISTAVSAGQFNTLATALTKAGLIDALKGKGPFTVFAPSDKAFAKLPKGTVESLLKPENKAQLTAILTYHVVSGRLDAKQVMGMTGATTLEGQRLSFKSRDGKVMIDNATVVTANIECSNGVIHVIDNVVLPESKSIPEVADSAKQFKTLLAAVKAAGLAETLMGKGPYTVFAPTDAAFAKLPEGTVESLLKPENRDKLVAILSYHVIKGRVYSPDAVKAGKATTLQGQAITISVRNGKAYADKAQIVATDIDAGNGVIHVIDAVMLPSAS
jgi:uncharacterized surface protein with fasciclin (FAS1) repeats